MDFQWLFVEPTAIHPQRVHTSRPLGPRGRPQSLPSPPPPRPPGGPGLAGRGPDGRVRSPGRSSRAARDQLTGGGVRAGGARRRPGQRVSTRESQHLSPGTEWSTKFISRRAWGVSLLCPSNNPLPAPKKSLGHRVPPLQPHSTLTEPRASEPRPAFSWEEGCSPAGRRRGGGWGFREAGVTGSGGVRETGEDGGQRAGAGEGRTETARWGGRRGTRGLGGGERGDGVSGGPGRAFGGRGFRGMGDVRPGPRPSRLRRLARVTPEAGVRRAPLPRPSARA